MIQSHDNEPRPFMDARPPAAGRSAHAWNANMVDHSVGVQDELHESEASYVCSTAEKVFFCLVSPLAYEGNQTDGGSEVTIAEGTV